MRVANGSKCSQDVPVRVDGIEVLKALPEAEDPSEEEENSIQGQFLGSLKVPEKFRPASEAQAEELGQGSWYQIAADRVALREGPSLGAAAVSSLRRGASLELFGWDETRTWRKCLEPRTMLQAWVLLEHPELGPLLRPSSSSGTGWRPMPLCDAAAEGRLEDMRHFLLDTQAAGTVDWQGRSPLALSASCNQLSCTVRLLEAGADAREALEDCERRHEELDVLPAALLTAMAGGKANQSALQLLLKRLDPPERNVAEAMLNRREPRGAFARDQHFPRVVMAAPVPGTCIRVLLRPETKGEGVWADVIRREKGTPHDVFFCETVESPLRKFRFCPEDVEKGQDEKVFKWSDAKEPKEKIEFMQSEIERMQKELVGGQLWLLDETVKKEDIQKEIEKLMEKSAADEELRKHVGGLLRRHAGSDEFWSAAEVLAGFLDKVNKSAEEFKEMITNAPPPELVQSDEYQCYAEFCCRKCGRAWQTILAWGVYDLQNKYKCDCLTAGTRRRRFHEVRVDEERLATVGCIHTLLNWYDLTQDRVTRMKWIPVDGAGPPQQGCQNCHAWNKATVCEIFWDQPGHGRHKPERCPKCRWRGEWCAGSFHRADVLLRYRVFSELITPGMEWSKSESGLETEFRYKGYRVLLQIRPYLFIIPQHREARTSTGQKEHLLRGDRIPAGADPVKLLLRLALERMHLGRTDDESLFDDAEATMGCKLYGPWRAYSLYGRRNDYGERHGVVYYKPRGWVKRRIKVEAAEWEKIKDWPILWHGTSLEHAAEIVFTSLRKPGEGGCRIVHGQAGSTTKTTIYLSPALGVSSHPVYSRFFELKKGQLWVQVVFQCKARPGSWQVRNSTLGGVRHWPRQLQIDQNFKTHENLEFLVEDPADVVVTGLMFRQFGPAADASICGDLVKQVNDRNGGGAKAAGYSMNKTDLKEAMNQAFEEEAATEAPDSPEPPEPKRTEEGELYEVVYEAIWVRQVPDGKGQKLTKRMKQDRFRLLRFDETGNWGQLKVVLAEGDAEGWVMLTHPELGPLVRKCQDDDDRGGLLKPEEL
ncbi:Putative fumarate reductase [Durusdinium trenchii]|uniref:Fumarate reductase n=1 Tax=Durusdinium trenchii TaxID=1381693 RepID=A0ABP0HA24_9DINO